MSGALVPRRGLLRDATSKALDDEKQREVHELLVWSTKEAHTEGR